MKSIACRFRRRRGIVVVAVVALLSPVLAGAAIKASWPSGGHDVSNSHSNAAETKVNQHTAGRLAVKWTAAAQGDVSAIPAVVNGSVYFPDWGGRLNRLDAATGAVLWSKPISTYDGISGSVSRASPAVDGNNVYLGDQNGGHLLAVNAGNGDPVWTTRLDDHPLAVLTGGPLVYNGVVYQGVASAEERAASDPNYPCCTFRGSVVAVDASTGTILWKTFTVPDNQGVPGGYSGGAVVGTTPAFDPASNTLFITTGNNYTLPQGVKDCENGGGSAGQCLSPDDHSDSVLALNASTGQIKWATNVQGFDDWNAACLTGSDPTNCPSNPGPGFGFDSGPNLFTIKNSNGQNELVVGAGQKSGQYWELDATTGQILWSTAAGPGSPRGGIEWGSATDGKRIYVAEANFDGTPYTIPSGQTITTGSWAALDPATGKILWQTPDPSANASGGGNDVGPVSVAGGVVYAPSLSGRMYALGAATGKVLWRFQAAGSVSTGAVPINGTIYWGDGYSQPDIPGATGSKTFYAFSLNGK